MRTLRLARVAAEAEVLLLRRRLRLAAIRAALAVISGLFLIGTIAMLHAYAWVCMVPHWGPATTALALAGFDAAVAIVLGLLAMRTPTDRIAVEAAVVRDQALTQIRSLFNVTSLLRPLAGLLVEQWFLRRSRGQSRD